MYVGGPGSYSGFVLREGAENKPEEGASKPEEETGILGFIASYIPFLNPSPAKPEETKVLITLLIYS